MRRKSVPCALCKKEETRDQDRICRDCRRAWEAAKTVEKAREKDGNLVEVSVNWNPSFGYYVGNVEGSSDISRDDIVEVLGGEDLGRHYWAGKVKVRIGFTDQRWGQDSCVYIRAHKGRAQTLKKIVTAFFNGIAKARAQGFEEGSNLLAQLAKGEIAVGDFTELRDAAKMQRKIRRKR